MISGHISLKQSSENGNDNIQWVCVKPVFFFVLSLSWTVLHLSALSWEVEVSILISVEFRKDFVNILLRIFSGQNYLKHVIINKMILKQDVIRESIEPLMNDLMKIYKHLWTSPTFPKGGFNIFSWLPKMCEFKGRHDQNKNLSKFPKERDHQST